MSSVLTLLALALPLAGDGLASSLLGGLATSPFGEISTCGELATSGFGFSTSNVFSGAAQTGFGGSTTGDFGFGGAGRR